MKPVLMFGSGRVFLPADGHEIGPEEIHINPPALEAAISGSPLARDAPLFHRAGFTIQEAGFGFFLKKPRFVRRQIASGNPATVLIGSRSIDPSSTAPFCVWAWFDYRDATTTAAYVDLRDSTTTILQFGRDAAGRLFITPFNTSGNPITTVTSSSTYSASVLFAVVLLVRGRVLSLYYVSRDLVDLAVTTDQSAASMKTSLDRMTIYGGTLSFGAAPVHPDVSDMALFGRLGPGALFGPHPDADFVVGRTRSDGPTRVWDLRDGRDLPERLTGENYVVLGFSTSDVFESRDPDLWNAGDLAMAWAERLRAGEAVHALVRKPQDSFFRAVRLFTFDVEIPKEAFGPGLASGVLEGVQVRAKRDVRVVRWPDAGTVYTLLVLGSNLDVDANNRSSHLRIHISSGRAVRPRVTFRRAMTDPIAGGFLVFSVKRFDDRGGVILPRDFAGSLGSAANDARVYRPSYVIRGDETIPNPYNPSQTIRVGRALGWTRGGYPSFAYASVSVPRGVYKVGIFVLPWAYGAGFASISIGFYPDVWGMLGARSYVVRKTFPIVPTSARPWGGLVGYPQDGSGGYYFVPLGVVRLPEDIRIVDFRIDLSNAILLDDANARNDPYFLTGEIVLYDSAAVYTVPSLFTFSQASTRGLMFDETEQTGGSDIGGVIVRGDIVLHPGHNAVTVFPLLWDSTSGLLIRNVYFISQFYADFAIPPADEEI